jgi:hypothetical protein
MAVIAPHPPGQEVLRLRPSADRRVAAQLERAALALTVFLPAPLIVYLGVNSGGYPKGITGVAAAMMGGLLLLRALLAPRTIRRPGVVASTGATALLALAAWQLLSMAWSDSATRAIAEFDRTVLYLLVFVTLATLPRRNLRPIVVATALGIATLAILGLATRLRPDLFPIAQPAAPARLSFPVTYWNAMGVMLACGLVLLLHLASELTGPRLIRPAAAALFPALAATLYFTLSRGGMGAAAAGLALYVLIARPRGLIPALAAIAAPTALAVLAAYHAPALVSETPTSAQAVIEGKDVSTAIAFWCFVAAFVRAVLMRWDRPLNDLRLPSLSPGWRRTAWLAGAVAVVIAAAAAHAPAKLHHQYERFVRNSPTSPIEDPRHRLTEVYNAGRISHWKVALDQSREHRVRGLGAGTFDEQWYQGRPGTGQVTEAHSLYVETLSELGIVGEALLAILVLSLFAAAVMRRHRREVAGVVAAVAAVWAAHAAIDWDWEMPVVTVIPLILAAGAASIPARRSNGRRRFTPAVIALAALALATLPTLNALAETRITEAQHAWNNDDCRAVNREASQARRVMPARPAPYALLALCALRQDRPADAQRLAAKTVRTDPHDWEWRYLDALVLGAAGKDPRPELARAVRLNPKGVAPTVLQRILKESPRDIWPLRSVQAYVWMKGTAYAAIRP